VIALIQANTVGAQDGKDAPESTISGLTGTARVKSRAFPTGPLGDVNYLTLLATLCGVDPNFFVNFELMKATRVSAPEISIVNPRPQVEGMAHRRPRSR